MTDSERKAVAAFRLAGAAFNSVADLFAGGGPEVDPPSLAAPPPDTLSEADE